MIDKTLEEIDKRHLSQELALGAALWIETKQ
jgi:hypothetical protein